jgi:hypothetical protein
MWWVEACLFSSLSKEAVFPGMAPTDSPEPDGLAAIFASQ